MKKVKKDFRKSNGFKYCVMGFLVNLQCYTVSLGKWVLTFQRIIMPSL